MMIDPQMALSVLAILAACLGPILISRNTRRATAVTAQGIDLQRIRDLRQETVELRAEVTQVRGEMEGAKGQATALRRQLEESNRRAEAFREQAEVAWREVAEVRRLAHSPGMTIPVLLERIGPPPQ